MASRDGQLHQAPDPAAGRHAHARAGQPGPAGRSLAPALVGPHITPPRDGSLSGRASAWPPVRVQARATPSADHWRMSVDVALARIAELHTLLAPRQRAAPAPAAAAPVRRHAAATRRRGSAPQAAGARSPRRAARRPGRGRHAGRAGDRRPRSAARSARPSSRPAPTTRRGSPSTARPPPAAASGRGARTSRRWAAREAGVPLGDNGQGFGRVDDVYAWAERSGKAIPAGGGHAAARRPDRLGRAHRRRRVGRCPTAAIQTIEGNSSDRSRAASTARRRRRDRLRPARLSPLKLARGRPTTGTCPSSPWSPRTSTRRSS